MTADQLCTHILYSGWASRRMLDAALKLSDEDLRRDMKVSHKSILGTLTHIYFADLIWFSRVVDPAIARHSPGDVLPLATLESEWVDLQKRWEDWAASRTGPELSRLVSYTSTGMREPGHTPVWQIVLHVVNHATQHRGQAVAMLRQLGIQPPAMDLILYYREFAAAM
jgi:uncharacterized damage-inducible protein DinB